MAAAAGHGQPHAFKFRMYCLIGESASSFSSSKRLESANEHSINKTEVKKCL